MMDDLLYDYFATTESNNYEDFEAHAELMQDSMLREQDRKFQESLKDSKETKNHEVSYA